MPGEDQVQGSPPVTTGTTQVVCREGPNTIQSASLVLVELAIVGETEDEPEPPPDPGPVDGGTEPDATLFSLDIVD